MEQFLLEQLHLHLSTTASGSPGRRLDAAHALLANPHTSAATRRAVVSSVAAAISSNPADSSFLRVGTSLLAADHDLSPSTLSTLRSLLDGQNPDAVTAMAAIAGSADDGFSAVRSILDEDLAVSLASSPSFAVRSRVLDLLVSSTRRGLDSWIIKPDVMIRVLLSLSSDLYPSARRAALDGLAALLEKARDGAVSDCCYGRAVELLKDEEVTVRLAAIRLVSLCGEMFAASEKAVGGSDKTDMIFLQLSSMARDMSMKVRVEAFNALGKAQQVTESVLLQSLSKKVIRTETASGVLLKCSKQPKLIFPCAAGVFAHGIEDEFYEVRIAACKSLGMLVKFSAQFAENTLNLLMDMMNDDSEAVRLQTLQTLFHMATYGCLKVQEKHMHMFLGLLMDVSAKIRSAARKILRLVNLPQPEMFKSAIDDLITNLEKYPEEEEDIYGALFSVGKNHGSFSANIAKHLATEIGTTCGELILDKPRTRALLALSISAPLTDKHNTFDIPAVIFSYAICLLGRISCALGEAIDRDSLFAYLCHRSDMPFLDKKLESTKAGQICSSSSTFRNTASEICSRETMWVIGSVPTCQGQSKKKSKCADEVLLSQTIKFILEAVERAWPWTKSFSAREVKRMLRTCKEELEMLNWDSSGSTSAFVSFLCHYVDATQLIIEIWEATQLENSHSFGIMSLDILLEKFDMSLRRMKYCFIGMTRELEYHILELTLLANLLRLSKVQLCSDFLLKKIHSIINRLESLCAEGVCDLSDFAKELKKAVNAKWIGDASNDINMYSLLEMFHLRPTTISGTLKMIMAELRVLDNDSENPLPYVSGLPVGIRFDIALYNISSHDRLWLRMVVGESIHYMFLDLCDFGSCDEVRYCSTVFPLYATPKASSFVPRVCVVMECPSENIICQQGQGGPKGHTVQLCDECNVYLLNITKKACANWSIDHMSCVISQSTTR